MIQKDKVKEIIRTYLPQADDEIIEEIASEIIRDVEAIIHSMVRQAVNQERESLYRKNTKE